VALNDNYTAAQGEIYLSGVQALVRLPLVQRLRDIAAGLNTARVRVRLPRLAPGRTR
jgi:indolepyruvate ferredoxin oxidoreductase